MTGTVAGWDLHVERGPECIFVRISHPDPQLGDASPLADYVWSVLEQHLTHRLILEMDEIEHLRSSLLGQLALLQKRLEAQGGLLRLCGLSEDNAEVLRVSRLADRLPHYANRKAAVMASATPKPR